jgi:uncharacterized protein YjcR
MENPEKPSLAQIIRCVVEIKFLLSMTDEEIAETFRVSSSTVACWKCHLEWSKATHCYR